MSAFTSEDLERMKGFINGTLDPRSEEAWNIRLHKRELYEALLNRLECAEKIASSCIAAHELCWVPIDLEQFEAWAKSKGEGSPE